MKAKTFITFVILILFSMITSFGIPKKVIDQIQMITVMGYDHIDDETIRGTAIVPNFISKTDVQNIVYSSSGELIYENQMNLNQVASEELYNGKMEIVLFGLELAEKGVASYTDYLTRDPSVGSRTHLAIAEEGAYTIMQNVQTDQSAGLYFSDLIEHNIINGNIPNTNLKIFHSDITSKITDPFLPILTMNGDKVTLIGLGFFDKDKYVFNLPFERAFLFNVLKEEMGEGKYILKNEDLKAALQSIESTRNIKVTGSAENPKVQITLKLRGVVREYLGSDLKKDKKELNKMWQKEIESKGLDLIHKFQELGIDPLGIGLQVKAQYRGFKVAKWKEVYPEIDIKLKVDTKIMETGAKN